MTDWQLVAILCAFVLSWGMPSSNSDALKQIARSIEKLAEEMRRTRESK